MSPPNPSIKTQSAGFFTGDTVLMTAPEITLFSNYTKKKTLKA